jgi:hypothetical protein
MLILLEPERPDHMDANEELLKAEKDMDEAEDALASLDFPTDQWMLIKRYIHAAILHNVCAIATQNDVES